ncbi:MAG: acyl-CoA synthetase [Spirochaetales bacterium]|nr:acyl-CoA synthetase [Spirochaetales bacterium]
MSELLTFQTIAPDSRSPCHPVFAAAGGHPALDWEDFSRALDALDASLAERPEKRWALSIEDHALFVLGLVALLQRGKEIHLPPLVPPGGPPSAGPSADGEPLPLLSDSGAATVRLSLDPQSSAPCRDEWPRIDPGAARVVFHTSGSTGAPKLVPKTLIQVENEVAVLASLWGDSFRGATVFSTVSPLHFYGFLFTAVVPFALGAGIAPERVRFPEALAGLSGRRTVLVTSPAFLKRLDETPGAAAPRPAPGKIFSSGGFLPEAAARTSRDTLGAPVHEIYGSTETGGIAWRVSPGSATWTLFPGVAASGIDDGGFTVASSYLPAPGAMRIEDRIEIVEDGAIRLLGRTDSVVKVEEKRVALNDVENRLYETGLVEDAVVLAFEDDRQYLAAAVALNAAGRERFRGAPKIEINRFFRGSLRAFFDPVVIPRKWRFPESIPRNPQGKIDRVSVGDLFTPRSRAGEPLDRDGQKPVTEPVVHARSESPGGLELVLSFPANYVHFIGHFPGLPILPAVAQVDWAMKLARGAFGLPYKMKAIPRFKCAKAIVPDTRVRLELSWNEAAARLAFTYSNPADGSLYSQGKILLEAQS